MDYGNIAVDSIIIIRGIINYALDDDGDKIVFVRPSRRRGLSPSWKLVFPLLPLIRGISTSFLSRKLFLGLPQVSPHHYQGSGFAGKGEIMLR